MNIQLSGSVIAIVNTAEPRIQRAFLKQLAFLARDLAHPGLHAKKYNEATGLWQARVNDDWRFYFVIVGDTYRIVDLVPHPK